MSKRRRKSRPRTRAEPRKRSALALVTGSDWDKIFCSGYTPLNRNPEIVAAVDTVARLIGSMTIHLMRNTPDGDVRVQDELSRKIDINPNQYQTRFELMYWVVRTLMLEGNGNAVVWPKTENGYLRELIPIPATSVSFSPSGWGYTIAINGATFDPGEVLHFVLNPDPNYPWKGEGLRAPLSDVAKNLSQAAETERGFMSSKWKPSLIVKVDALNDEFSSKEGRAALLDQWVASNEAGAPWLIPSDQFSVEQVRPLSLSDLALSDMVQLDKRTAASVVGVPAFVMGVGAFNRDEWNNFIRSRIMPLAASIQQTMTKTLLYSPDLYLRFNPRSLYSYDMRDMAAVADDQYIRGIMTGNEVRDWLGLAPIEGLDQLVILENYIPAGMIGDQKKLNQTGGETTGSTDGENKI